MAKKQETKTEKKVKEQEKKIVKKVEDKPTKQVETKKEIKQFNDPYKIVMYPVSTEKSIRLMESENKLIFRVSLKSKKSEIKKAIEDLFKVKIINIKTLITQKGHKRAYIKFSDETPAIDIATQLGMM
tara:strand:- start:245 stop:628 length:384 start_codon:yes stop_codon:yes gene_type:complete